MIAKLHFLDVKVKSKKHLSELIAHYSLKHQSGQLITKKIGMYSNQIIESIAFNLASLANSIH